jgi:ribosomal protein L32
MLPRSCFRADGKPKKAFASKGEAKRFRRKWQHIYECPNCSHWHLAHNV